MEIDMGGDGEEVDKEDAGLLGSDEGYGKMVAEERAIGFLEAWRHRGLGGWGRGV